VSEAVDDDVVLLAPAARLLMFTESSSAERARFFLGAKNDVIMVEVVAVRAG
jgi:hypothetical protein